MIGLLLVLCVPLCIGGCSCYHLFLSPRTRERDRQRRIDEAAAAATAARSEREQHQAALANTRILTEAELRYHANFMANQARTQQ